MSEITPKRFHFKPIKSIGLNFLLNLFILKNATNQSEKFESNPAVNFIRRMWGGGGTESVPVRLCRLRNRGNYDWVSIESNSRQNSKGKKSSKLKITLKNSKKLSLIFCQDVSD